MKSLSTTALLALMLSAALTTGASAAPVFDMAEWATNQDGVFTDHQLAPNQTFSDWTITLNFSGTGSHKAIGFVDPEIDQDTSSNFWFGDYGTVFGAAAAGESWEIDEPGWVFGNIVDNFAGNGSNVASGTLDNTNSVPSGSEDDVSMALGWDFILGTNESAVVQFFLKDVLPTSFSGFYLTQTNAETGGRLYYYSTLDISQCDPATQNCDGGGGGGTVPEPATLSLLGIALASMFVARRKTARG